MNRLIWSRFKVLRIWHGAIYLRIPKELQESATSCGCPYCRAHPDEPPMWDTLGVPLQQGTTAWTVHAPEWTTTDRNVSDEPEWVRRKKA